MGYVESDKAEIDHFLDRKHKSLVRFRNISKTTKFKKKLSDIHQNVDKNLLISIALFSV